MARMHISGGIVAGQRAASRSATVAIDGFFHTLAHLGEVTSQHYVTKRNA